MKPISRHSAPLKTSLLFAFLLATAFSGKAFASAPVSASRAKLEVCYESTEICNLLYNLTLARQGEAATNQVGEVSLPYHFEAMQNQEKVELIIDKNSDGTVGVFIY